MGCCACCLGEDGQIKKILEKVEIVTVSNLNFGETKFAVGRTVQIQGQDTSLIAPVSQKPCVYYEVRCEKEEITRDEEGREQRRWVRLFYEQRYVDFLLSDGIANIYVPAATNQMKVYTVVDAHGQENGGLFSIFTTDESDTNPHLKALLNRHGVGNYGFHSSKIRYREGCFALNEQVAVMGTASHSQSHAGTTLMLLPVKGDAYTDEYFEQHGWSGLEIKCWHALTETPSLIGTDDGKYMNGIFIPMLPPNFVADSLVQLQPQEIQQQELPREQLSSIQQEQNDTVQSMIQPTFQNGFNQQNQQPNEHQVMPMF